MAYVSIHQASLANLTDLLEIEQNSFSSDRVSHRQMRYILSQAKAFSLTAKMESKIVAYCTCFTPRLPRAARLYSLAVLPAYRDKGIASKLLKKVWQKLRSLNYMSCNLEVRKEDRHTQALYAKYGFKEIQLLPGYYEDGADGIRMKCEFKTQKVRADR